jgi:hypothetical protein
MRRLILASLALFALTGCATADFENRVAQTLDCKEAHVLSKWRFFAFAFRLSDDDAFELAKLKAACPRRKGQ